MSEHINQLPATMPDLAVRLQVTNIMHNIGFPAHLKGYYYLREGILTTLGSTDTLCPVTKQLYPEIARNNHSTPASVERAMRHAINVTWKRGSSESISMYFGSALSRLDARPTNSEFIAAIVDYVRMNSHTYADSQK